MFRLDTVKRSELADLAGCYPLVLSQGSTAIYYRVLGTVPTEFVSVSVFFTVLEAWQTQL